jgi:hypothetical protein
MKATYSCRLSNLFPFIPLGYRYLVELTQPKEARAFQIPWDFVAKSGGPLLTAFIMQVLVGFKNGKTSDPVLKPSSTSILFTPLPPRPPVA